MSVAAPDALGASPDRVGGLLAAVFGWLVVPVTRAWVWNRRRSARLIARPLNAAERAAVAECFSGPLLESVRVAEVRRIPESRLVRVARAIGLRKVRVLTGMRGLCLGDVVLVAEMPASKAKEAQSLLFHELVHVAQYRRLGTTRFLATYLGQWAACGFDYGSIPLESEAYALQARFDRGERFVVREACLER